MGALDNQLEEAARQLGVTIEDNNQPVSEPAEVIGEAPEAVSEPIQEEPTAQEPVAQEVESKPLPEEDVLTINDTQAEEPVSSLTSETESSSEAEEDDFDIDEAVVSFLSERLGTQIDSLDDLPYLFQTEQPQVEIDERLKIIADFMEETGRSPEDWFLYQSIKPDEMSDLDAVRYSLQSQYQNLSGDEIDLLVSSKYKLDDSVYSDEEVRLSTLQLKIDAADAKTKISSLRDNYLMPVIENTPQQNESIESPINDEWVGAMAADAESLEAITFELGDSEFNFGISDEYRNSMIDKNANIESYFDDYINRDGSWDFEKLNMHRALLDNVDEIVQSVYKQGLSDGQRNLVDKAANVDVSTPRVNPQSADSNQDLINEIVEKLRPDNRLKFF